MSVCLVPLRLIKLRHEGQHIGEAPIFYVGRVTKIDGLERGFSLGYGSGFYRRRGSKEVRCNRGTKVTASVD